MDQQEDIQQPENVNKPLYKPVNVLDSRLNVNDSVMFAVEKGSMNNTVYKIPASSQSVSQINFESKISSLSTVISRKAYVQTTLEFTCNKVGNSPAGIKPFELGRQATLNAFPFQNGVVRNSSLTLNNQNFTLINEEMVDILLRSIDPVKLQKAADTTPVCLNDYPNLNDAFEFKETVGGRPLQDSVFYKNSCYSIVANPNTTASAYNATTVTVTITEPLLLSPFILDDCDEESGMYGIDTLSLSFLLNSAADKTKSILTTVAGANYELTNVQNSSLFLTFLTPHASLSLPSRNVIPYLQCDVKKYPVGPVLNSASGSVATNSFTLNSTPDAVFVSVRRAAAKASSTTPMDYLQIKDVTVNYGNRSGMFSNEPIESLYNRSKSNGVYMDFNTWNGSKNVMTYTNASDYAAGPPVVVTTVAVPTVATVRTVGPVVLLNLARDGFCQQDSEAPGSISGNSVQISVNFVNNTRADFPANTYELHCMFVYSGLIVNSLGSTNLYVGILSKKEILEVSQQKSINKAVISRQYGGSLWSSLKSYGKKAYKMYKRTKPAVSKINNVMKEIAPDNKLSRGLSTVGYGYSGAGTGAGYSGAGKLKGRIY
jgi:hypothetical protein